MQNKNDLKYYAKLFTDIFITFLSQQTDLYKITKRANENDLSHKNENISIIH